MAPLQNPLLSAGEFLVSETERLENVHPFDELFNGPKEQVEKRWAGSAVLDSAGGWHIVCMSSHIVESGGTRRIRLYSGGVFGRSQPRAVDWFKSNAESLFLGALQLPEGTGAKALHKTAGRTTWV